MTAQTINIHQISKFCAIAIILHSAEFFFPTPIFGIKPGIANIIILFTYLKFNFKSAVYVSLIRVFISSLIIGTFITPTFFISLSGAILSLIFLFLCQSLSHQIFSIYTFSMLMGLGHILGQFIIVRIFFIPDDGVFILFPIFLLFTFIFSLINAFIVSRLISPSN